MMFQPAAKAVTRTWHHRPANALKLTCSYAASTFLISPRLLQKVVKDSPSHFDSSRRNLMFTRPKTGYKLLHCPALGQTIVRQWHQMLWWICHICSSSSILMCDQIGANVFAVIMPLAAAAGTPMPGCVESPHLQQQEGPRVHNCRWRLHSNIHVQLLDDADLLPACCCCDSDQCDSKQVTA